MRPFSPLFRNPHLATIAASFWPRRLDERRFPVQVRLCTPEPGVQVLIHTQRPPNPVADVVLVHGLEGSSQGGYMRSMAQALLEAGFAVHRFNLRTCGGTEFLCRTLYHAGLTSDLFAFLMQLDRERRTPVHLVGFSLGGNVVLKLAGELGDDARRLLASVCAISTPLDLGLCARRIGERSNRLYEWHFLRSMKRRLRLRREILGDRIAWDALPGIRSIYEIDDRITAPSFGFRDAEHYYSTQSAIRFVAGVHVPALLVQSKDDPLIPFSVFSHPALRENGLIQVLTTGHGGHIGFVSSKLPRMWVDGVVIDWVAGSGNK